MIYNISELTLKALRFSPKGANVEIPQIARVTGGHATARRNENNEPVSGSISKIVLTALDAAKAKILAENGISASEMKGFTIEIEADEQQLKAIDLVELVGSEISLANAELAPLWVSRGQNGSYSGLKVIIHEVKQEGGK